ncbi:uncharacterized protein [Dysidea avara]|uniref:uncharacterized protein isoform X2 n=1 Tax=Dysidea avara TaxID=196820 RepID=UPI003317C0E8
MLILCGHFSSMHILLATSSGTPCRLLNDYACVHMFIRYICIYLITGTVKLPEGEYQYKFIVDEEWVHDPQEESVYNNFGSRNNVLKITSKDFEASEKKVNKAMINFMLEACRKGETMKVRFGRVLFIGASGAGKTSFCNLLLRKAFEPKHISTGLHKYDRVSAIKISMQQSDNHVQFSVLDLEKEIDELRSRLNFITEHSQGTDLSQSEESDGKYEEKTETDLNKLCSVERSIAKDSESNTRLPTFNKDDTWNILTFLDTGGQPQFISMLPAVNSCAMVTFIIHNMTNKLSSPVTVTHGDKDGNLSYSPYPMGCTYLQLIRSLISFVGSNQLGRRREEIFNDIIVTKKQNRSYVSFVGTHLDKCTIEARKSLGNIDKELNFVVSDSPLSHVWKKVHKNYKVLIPVNNTTADTDDEDQCASVIRNKLYEALCEQNTYEVPIVWLILELEIRQICKERQNYAISYAEVVTLCREKKLLDKEDDIKNGLRFHHLFGTLLYFEDVVEMSDIIFTDLQWLFDKLTDIVELSCDNSDVKASQDFEHKGIFRSTMLDRLNFSINDINIANKDFKKSFLKFLEYLRIIAPIHQTNCITEKYFMPCLLTFENCESQSDFLSSYGDQITNGNIKVCPLLLHFTPCSESSGPLDAFPRGIFCYLVVELLQDVSKWNLVWSISRCEVFGNLVTLSHTRTGHKVTLIDRILFLEVQIRHKDNSQSSIHFQVKEALEESLVEICNQFNYYDFEISFGFLCKECQGGETHMAKLSVNYQTCECYFGKTTRVTNSHRIWFEKEKSSTQRIHCGSVLKLSEFNRYIRPQVARKWYDLGIKLSLNVEKLNNIEANNPRDIERCCTQMYQHWLNSDLQASREKLAVALQHIGYSTLAERVWNNSMEGMSSKPVNSMMSAFSLSSKLTAMMSVMIVILAILLYLLWN